MLAKTPDHRRAARRYTRRTATVSFGPNSSPVDCVIWDISESGARLSIALPSLDVPHHFTLNLYKDSGLAWNCEVIWSDAKYIGVKFNGLVS
jgi:hypothetical protein